MQSRIGLLLAGLIVGLSSPIVEAAPFVLTQITNATCEFGSGDTAINATGTRIAFDSYCDLTPGHPGNADGNVEIFLFDTTTRTLRQITNTTGSCFNLFPLINATGTRIAFTSDCDLIPGGNADGNSELFLFDTTTGTFSQITHTTGADCGIGFPTGSINATGTRIVFWSYCDLIPGSNADGNAEIFLFDTTTRTLSQITHTTGWFNGFFVETFNNFFPSIDATGTRIAFTSDRNLAPGSPGNAKNFLQIFLFDTTTNTFTQITNITGPDPELVLTQTFLGRSIDATGTRIVFQSGADLTPGSPGNANGRFEIFLFDTTTGTFTQITTTPGFCGHRDPTISGTGTRIAFDSNCDLVPGSNADGNVEIFLFDTTTRTLTQITHTTGGVGVNEDANEVPSLDATGARIAFMSNRDLTPGSPGNADANWEVYLASELTPVPTLSEWGQLAMGAVLVLGGLLALRRRRPSRLTPS